VEIPTGGIPGNRGARERFTPMPDRPSPGRPGADGPGPSGHQGPIPGTCAAGRSADLVRGQGRRWQSGCKRRRRHSPPPAFDRREADGPRDAPRPAVPFRAL